MLLYESVLDSDHISIIAAAMPTCLDSVGNADSRVLSIAKTSARRDNDVLGPFPSNSKLIEGRGYEESYDSKLCIYRQLIRY